MSLRETALSSVLLAALLAAAPALAQSPAQTPISRDGILALQHGGASVEDLLAIVKAAASVTPLAPDDVLALKHAGVPDSVIAVYLARQAEGVSLSSAPASPNPAPTRRLRITGQLSRVLNLTRSWVKFPEALVLPYFKDPMGQGVMLLIASRVSDAGRNNIPMAPQQPVCWCASGNGCTSLKVLSVQGSCGRLENPGDGNWERHLSSSEWKTVRYQDTFVALNLDMPPIARVVELSILANRCGGAGSYMFPITSTHTDRRPGSPAPFYLSFNPHGSKDFTASIELRIVTDGVGAFDVGLANVTIDDRDSETSATTEKCMRAHGGPECRWVSLDEDLDGLLAGVATPDSSRCQ